VDVELQLVHVTFGHMDSRYITYVFKYSPYLVRYKTLCFQTTDVFPGVGRLEVDLAGKGGGNTS
jgi:hypothetical protein